MDMLSFILGVILGVGIPYAIVEVRAFLFHLSVRRMGPELPTAPASTPPRLQCPLPSPHSPHDERVCAISWYLKHQKEPAR